MVVHVATVSLVVLGASLAIMIASWRGTTLALAAHYLGVALLLGTSASLARGLVTLAVGLGVVAILADFELADDDRRSIPSILRSLIPDPRSPRPFDLTVLTLVVIGAIGLTASRPLVG